MVSISIEKKNGKYKRLSCVGHAGYAEYGKDIVCAAASILVINTINSIEKFCGCALEVSEDEKKGFISCVFPGEVDEGARLLMDSLAFGLSEIEKNYGRRFISFKIKEDMS